MADKNEIKKRIREEEDYIRSPKFSNSLNKFLIKNSEGIDDAAIGRILMLTDQEVEDIYQEAVDKLRDEMAKEDDDL